MTIYEAMFINDLVKITKIKGEKLMLISQTVQIMCGLWVLRKLARNTVVYNWELLYEKSCLNEKVSKY